MFHIILLSLLTFSNFALAQSNVFAVSNASADGRVGAIYERLVRLEENLNMLQRAFYSDGVPVNNDSVSSQKPLSMSKVDKSVIQAETDLFFDRVLNIEKEQQILIGNYEVLYHEIESISTRLDKLVVDLDFRLRSVEDNIQALRSQSSAQQSEGALDDFSGDADAFKLSRVQTLGVNTAQSISTASKEEGVAEQTTEMLIPQDGSVKEKYRAALNFIRTRQYDKAEQAFNQFLKAHPNDELSSNAYYWQAESLYVRKDYERAAVVFLNGYKAFPDGKKSPDILLKLSRSFSEMGDNNQACTILFQFKKAFPDLQGATVNYVAQDLKKLSCQDSGM